MTLANQVVVPRVQVGASVLTVAWKVPEVFLKESTGQVADPHDSSLLLFLQAFGLEKPVHGSPLRSHLPCLFL